MKYAFSLFVAMLLAGVAIAQQPSVKELIPKAKWTKEQIENPPARVLKMNLRAEPIKEVLREASRPIFGERTFMVTIILDIPKIEGRPRSNEWSRYLDRSKLPMGNFSDGYLLLPEITYGRTSHEKNATQLKYLLTQAPEGSIDKETVAFFKSPEASSKVFGFSGRISLSNGVFLQEFRILCKSKEECERCAKGLMTLLDYGFSRPLQLRLLQKREELVAEIATARKQLVENEKELTQVDKRLTEFKDFTPEMLPTLRQQQIALDVDLAGTMARIKACEALLAATRPALSADRRASVEDTKIQAEINLAGYQAQRITLLEFVSQVKEKIILSDRRNLLRSDLNVLRKVLESRPGLIQEIDADLDFVAPLKVADDQFVVQPIEWTTP
ncbi:hypothetical protein [Anatilimnocola floriformis]|uniref:hypothetical protein n=1 Tax=Anatilimnocola floriformis TaxID=2948575 RepID=UPI0020C2510E|nr:hypothetical protein [Anatilimnocola floriformis]